jgi:hypothetical protein
MTIDTPHRGRGPITPRLIQFGVWLALADSLSTWAGIKLGVQETSPFMVHLIGSVGLVNALALRAAIGTAVFALAWLALRRWQGRPRKALIAVTAFGVVWTALIVANNVTTIALAAR